MSSSNSNLPADQISPQEILVKAIEIKNILVKNWLLVVAFSAAGFAIGYALDLFTKKPDTYFANITFNLGGSSSNSMGGLGGLAASMGMGATPDANIFTGENFNYFVKSRPVLERTLMKYVDVWGKKTLLANYYIDSSGIKMNEWEELEDMQTFKFKGNEPDSFNLEERKALNAVVAKLNANAEVGPIDRKSSFISVGVTSQSPLLSQSLVENLLKTVEELYTENQTAKTRKIMIQYKKRPDSLAFVLGKTENQLARTMDENLFVIAPEAKSQASKLTRSSSFVQSLYHQSLAEYDNLRLNLIRETPLFTVIEPVQTPLEPKTELAKKRQIGVFVGLILAFVIIYFKTLYRKALAEKKV
jgi:uncharacterized protein involved in exopolysaccharide biosynthesis